MQKGTEICCPEQTHGTEICSGPIIQHMLILGTEFLEQTHRTELELKLDVRDRRMEHNWKENTIEQNAQFVE